MPDTDATPSDWEPTEAEYARAAEISARLSSATLTPQQAVEYAQELYRDGDRVSLYAAAKIWLTTLEALKSAGDHRWFDCWMNAEACLAKAGAPSSTTVGRMMKIAGDLGLDPTVFVGVLTEGRDDG